MNGSDQPLTPGPWSRWWCRAHQQVEDPGHSTPERVCGECGHVYRTAQEVTEAYLAWARAEAPGDIELCGFCLSFWSATGR